jgi:mRNA interferase MazF
VRLVAFRQPDKLHPVVVLTNPGAIPYLSKITVAAVTSTVRGVPSEVILDEEDGMKHRCAVNLFNLTTVDKSEIGRHLAQLSPLRLRQICEALSFTLGCEQ